MPRGSRNKSHRQHHKQLVKDLEESDEGENTRYGPELLPAQKAEGKRGKEEGKLDFSREKHDIQKRKLQSQSRELGPGSSATYFSGKRKRGVEPLDSVEADASAMSGGVDRWNGGDTQGDALSSLPYHSRTDSESSDKNVGVMDDKDEVRTEDKGKKSMRGRGSDTGGGYANTKPSVIDLPDSSVRGGRSKGSRRRETQGSAADQGNSLKLSEESLLLGNMDSHASYTGKAESIKSGSKGRWDKGVVARKESKEADEGTVTSSRDVQRSLDREKKGRNIKSDSMPIAPKNHDSHRIEGFVEDSSSKQEQKNIEWQLQDEVRNIELEKELANRILKRREESGERDRWRDDERDLEGKRFHRDERKKDERYKDEKQRDDRYKDDRHRDDRNKDYKYREDKYVEDRHKGDKHQDNKHREWRLSRERTAEKYDSKHARDGSRLPENRCKENKHYDSDRDYSSQYDDQYTQHKDHRDQIQVGHTREDSRDTKTHAIKVSSSEGHIRGSNTGHQDENRDHEKLLSVPPSCDAGDSVNDKKLKRVHGFGSDIQREDHRSKFKQSESESRDTFSEEKPPQARNERLARNLEQLGGHVREPGILHFKNKMDKKLESHRDESPLGSARSSAYDGRTSPVLSHVESSPKNNGRLSPGNMPRKSPSSYIHELGHSLSYEKTTHKNKFETGSNVGNSVGMRIRSPHYFTASDREKQQSLADEIGFKDPRGLYKSTEEHRRSPSTERNHDSQVNNPAIDEASRAPYSSICRAGSTQDSRRMPSGGSSASCERPSKGRRLEEAPLSRSDWTVHPTPVNRQGESSIRPQASILTSRPSVLPPPPPFRPGIDNPAILGSSSTGFDEAPSSRDQRRVERQVSSHFKRGEIMGGSAQIDAWKGVGNWNAHGQGQGPGNMFIPFQHHIGGHPHGGFLNMGQQFPGPPLFGVRPSADMGSVRYHVRDGVDAFPGHNRTFGWQRQFDDGCGPHIQVPLHGWEGPGSYGEESHNYGRSDRDQIGQAISARSWERGTEMWKTNSRDTDEAWGGSQVSRGRMEKSRRERSPTESIEIKRSDESPPKAIKENQCSNLASDMRKPSKNKRDRMSVYLSNLDVSVALAGLELYKKCAEMLDSKENTISNSDAVMKDRHPEDANGDFQLEVDADAEALLHDLNVQSIVFPSLPKEVFERAFALYNNATGETKIVPVGYSHSNPKPTMEEVHKVTAAFESSREGIPCTKVYDKTNAIVDMAIVPENTSTGLASTLELQVSQGVHDVKNQLQMSQENLGIATQGDVKGNDLGTKFDVKEPIVNVNAMGNLQPLDDVNITSCLEELVKGVDAMGPSAEPTVVGDLELVGDCRPLGLSEESVIGPDTTFCLEANSKASSEAKESFLKENMEENNSISSARVQDTVFRGTEDSPKDYSATIDRSILIAESGNDVVHADFSVPPFMELVRKCEEAEPDSKMHNSDTVSQVSEFRERHDDVNLNIVTLRHIDPNQQVEDLCAEVGIQQDESPENTDIALEKTVESVDSKIGIRNFSPYNPPRSTH